MRKYNSETDYSIVLAAARSVGEVWITPIAGALQQARIEWPGLQSKSNESEAVDRGIQRAWVELGYL